IAAAPVRHPAPRRAGQATSARRRPLPGGGRSARRLLGPERVLSSLQAPRRRHAATVPDVRKNRLTTAVFWKKPRATALTIPHERGRSASSPHFCALRRRAGGVIPAPPARHAHQVRDGADGSRTGLVADAAAEVFLPL